jgi:ferricrocin synthase
MFVFEGKAIFFDIEGCSWTETEVENAPNGSTGRTSLNLRKPTTENAERTLPKLTHTEAHETSLFALSLEYDPVSGHVTLSSTCRIPESFLKQILIQLEQIIVQHDSALELQFTKSGDVQLSVINPQRKVLPGPQLLHELISVPSAESIAIDFLSAEKQRTHVSYRDLHRFSDCLTAQIRSALSTRFDGSEEHRVIPVLIPQSPELYIAQIAILKAGAAFCPLTLDVPLERLGFIVKDVSAKVAVTTRDFKDRFLALDLDLVIIMSVTDKNDPRQADTVLEFDAAQKPQSDEDLAYVMYTSGSTGLPKGVGVSHKAVTQALLAHEEHVPDYHRFLQFAAPTFDVSVFEIFFTFHRGATLVCCQRETMLSDLTAIMNEMKIDAGELTPTVACTLLRSWDAVPTLRLLLMIGELLPANIIQNFAGRRDEGRVLLPMYGPTEASIHCTIASPLSAVSKPGIIGRPLSTVSAFVIDDDPTRVPQILPIGHVGELAVAGQLAHSYLNRPEQDGKAFINLRGYGRAYRTGDRARLLPSGDFECLGRIASGQVKIRGQRVELGEIEQVISVVSGVQVVIGSVLDGNIIVFCLLDDQVSRSVSLKAITDKCKAWLPAFMRPTDIILLREDPPRLSSGKIDKKGLEVAYTDSRTTQRPVRHESGNDLQQLIAQIMQNELGLCIMPGDDMWSKGLDSLRAIRLASELRKRGIQLAVADLLSADTITTLSETFEKTKNAVDVGSESDIAPSHLPGRLRDLAEPEVGCEQLPSVEDIVPCSALQVAMLSETMLATNLNINRMTLKLGEAIPLASFVKAFESLAQLNDMLRSGFVQLRDQNDQFARVIWKNFDAENQIQYTGSTIPIDSPTQAASDLDLLRPLRLKVFVSERHTQVSVHIHHALYDGWSWDLIMADLRKLIAGEVPPKRPQFREFVLSERALLSSDEANSAQEYWQDHLRDASPTPMPVLTLRKCVAETRTSQRSLALNVHSLTTLSQELRISRHAIPSAAFATLLKLYCGTSEVLFGSVSSGRNVPVPGIEDIIGPCISTLPVRINFDQLRTVSDLLVHTHRLHQNFLRFGQLPLQEIKKVAGFHGDRALFDALFVWQESLIDRAVDGAALSVIEGVDSLQYALTLELEPRDSLLHAKMTYKSSVVCDEQVELFMSQFDAILEFYVQSPDAPLDGPFYFQAQQLSIANPVFEHIDSQTQTWSTIDRFAECDPTRTAIEFVHDFHSKSGVVEMSRLSYRELHDIATCTAHLLRSRGVSVNDLVCLFMEKSIQLYTSILGVLRAGAGYVVIDPLAPRERTNRILDAANCQHILTRRNLEGYDVLSKAGAVTYFEDIEMSPNVDTPLPEAPSESLAYAVFTSGSTGIPKGVLITRKNIFTNIEVLSLTYPSVVNGALLQACSPAFDGKQAHQWATCNE